ncbi:protein N-terminal glutamine amidohydrolase [Genypterus blacodes]|uniref:protein N-terminal glutamine amidohydrolase n=1 Tax=Genypterus blacodes TaxID=154954 RepID=UPI003F767333
MEETGTEDRITPSRENCVYTSCYCEENVWKLCEFVKEQRSAQLDNLSVIFISNDSRKVPLWKQRSGHSDQPVIWDYHVVLLRLRQSADAQVYDLDSLLSFPCSLPQYAAEALRSDRSIKRTFHRKLRIIQAKSFLQNFASDRSHMKTAEGTWTVPPPAYPPIQTAESHMNLDDFISMKPSVGWGGVYSLDHFLQRFMPSSASAATESELRLPAAH